MSFEPHHGQSTASRHLDLKPDPAVGRRFENPLVAPHARYEPNERASQVSFRRLYG